MAIRQANLKTEYDELNAFYNEHWQDDGASMQAELLDQTKRASAIVLRSDRDQKLVGLSTAIQTKSEQKPVLCSKLVVHREFRRQGIASELINDLIEIIDSKNKPAILNVDISKSGYIKLYQDFGFVASPGEEDVKDAQYLFMERPALLSTP